MDNAIFTKVWVARLLISLAGTAVIAWGVSFLVSDYVVRANTASSAQTIEAVLQSNAAATSGNQASVAGIQTALETLNATLQETNRAVGGLREDLTFLVGLQKDSAQQIATLQGELDRLAERVAKAGIDVNFATGFKGLFSPSSEMWSAIRDEYGISDQQPVFIKIEPSKPLQ